MPDPENAPAPDVETKSLGDTLTEAGEAIVEAIVEAVEAVTDAVDEAFGSGSTTQPAPIKEGDLVNYSLDLDSPYAGQVRGAIVVKVWNATCLNLRVFADGTNDYPPNVSDWKTSIVEGAPGAPRTWHRKGV